MRAEESFPSRRRDLDEELVFDQGGARDRRKPRELSILALAVGAFLVARSLAPEMALGIAFVAWGGLSLLTWFLSQLLALRTGKEREG
jgi:hypothetical protein